MYLYHDPKPSQLAPHPPLSFSSLHPTANTATTTASQPHRRPAVVVSATGTLAWTTHVCGKPSSDGVPGLFVSQHDERAAPRPDSVKGGGGGFLRHGAGGDMLYLDVCVCADSEKEKGSKHYM